MLDLSKEKIEVKCNCGRKHNATFQDVINRKRITCLCGDTIQLTDQDGSVKKGVTDINKAFKGLDDAFKRFGR